MRASAKPEAIQDGASCDSVSGLGRASRKCAMDLGDDWKEMSEKGVGREVDGGCVWSAG